MSAKLSQKWRILKILWDCKWHRVDELHEICWRYGARLWDLRREGFVFDKSRCQATRLERWKLINKTKMRPLMKGIR
jgi:hypothetical protein